MALLIAHSECCVAVHKRFRFPFRAAWSGSVQIRGLSFLHYYEDCSTYAQESNVFCRGGVDASGICAREQTASEGGGGRTEKRRLGCQTGLDARSHPRPGQSTAVARSLRPQRRLAHASASASSIIQENTKTLPNIRVHPFGTESFFVTISPFLYIYTFPLEILRKTEQQMIASLVAGLQSDTEDDPQSRMTRRGLLASTHFPIVAGRSSPANHGPSNSFFLLIKQL